MTIGQCQKFLRSSIALLLLPLAACTEPGQLTGVGAATGGVMGAGLGAIVGSQTGSAGAGLAIGAAAGAGAGAAVGNVLEAQDQAIRQQDEAIERQENIIRAQRGEIDELRRLGQDSVRFRSRPGYQGEAGYRRETVRLNPPLRSSTTSGVRSVPMQAGALGSTKISGASSSGSTVNIPGGKPVARVANQGVNVPPSQAQRNASEVINKPAEKIAAVSPKEIDAKGLVAAEVQAPTSVLPVVEEESNKAPQQIVDDTLKDDSSPPAVSPPAMAVRKGDNISEDCLNAESEFQQASTKSEVPDKLFHLRRALRLCPDDPRFHSNLGDVYKTLGRASDAQYEYQEALKLSPDDATLKEKLSQANATKDTY